MQVDFDNLNASTFANFDAGFSCMGTVIAKVGKVSDNFVALLVLKTVLITLVDKCRKASTRSNTTML